MKNIADSTLIPRPSSDEIIMIPLSGVGHIGRNMTLYGHKDRWIMIDAGIQFKEDDDPENIVGYIPDVMAVAPILEKIEALVITHAHEDHIGAITSLWPNTMTCPIWATPYATAIVRQKIEECQNIKKVTLNTFNPGDQLSLAGMIIDTILLTHSVPEPLGLHIRAGENGPSVFHTGDWKVDLTPVTGKPTDYDGLERASKNGVTALVCDSTNADRDLDVTSERDLINSFRRIFQNTNGAVILTCFSSNISRIASALIAARETGRYTAIAGYSMNKHLEAALELGYLDDDMLLSSPSHLRGLDRNQRLLICTGSQGEENSVLYRLAHRKIRNIPGLIPGDAVIRSARTIPGNNEQVEALESKIRKSGVRLYTDERAKKGQPVHVTGHAGAKELAFMHAMINPSAGVIPVHGEEHHMNAHAEIAKKGGYASLIPTEGDILSVQNGSVKKIGSIPTGTTTIFKEKEANCEPVVLQKEKELT